MYVHSPSRKQFLKNEEEYKYEYVHNCYIVRTRSLYIVWILNAQFC